MFWERSAVSGSSRQNSKSGRRLQKMASNDRSKEGEGGVAEAVRFAGKDREPGVWQVLMECQRRLAAEEGISIHRGDEGGGRNVRKGGG